MALQHSHTFWHCVVFVAQLRGWGVNSSLPTMHTTKAYRHEVLTDGSHRWRTRLSDLCIYAAP